MSVYLSRAFWRAALERATKTAAQGAGAGAITGATLTDGHAVLALLLTAAAGFVFSIVTSVASAQIGEHGSPSLTDAETLAIPGGPDGAPTVYGA